MINELTPDVKEAIKAISERLPSIPIKVTPGNKTFKFYDKNGKLCTKKVPKPETIPIYQKMSGESILAKGIQIKGGEVIDAKKMYTLEVGVKCIDHYSELLKAYQRNGLTGTRDYIDKIKKQHNENVNK